MTFFKGVLKILSQKKKKIHIHYKNFRKGTGGYIPWRSHCSNFVITSRQPEKAGLNVKNDSLTAAPGASLEAFLVRKCNKLELPLMPTSKDNPHPEYHFP